MNPICTNCKDPKKSIKAKGLCNACYTAEHRRRTKEQQQQDNNNNEEEELKFKELESKLKETREALEKQKMENSLLRKEVSTLKENNGDNLTTTMNLSEGFIQENLMKSFHYDERKYMEYLELVKKSSRKWNSLGEEQLTKIFPCFKILLEQYSEKM